MKITIPARILRAAFSVVDIWDIRKEITGVRLDKENNAITATNGFVMYAHSGCDLSALKESITIPPFLLCAAGHKKRSVENVILSFSGEYRQELRVELVNHAKEIVSVQIITPLCSQVGYPNIDKVIPAGAGVPETSTAFSPKYMVMARKAISGFLRASFHEDNTCVITSKDDPRSKFLIMGLRDL